MIKDPFIYSHRRSGRHFLMNSILRNFRVNHLGRVPVCHVPTWAWSERPYAQFWYDRDETQPIVIHRDGRDALVSLYHWCIHEGGGGIRSLANEYIKNKPEEITIKSLVDKMTFSEWLRSDTFVSTFPDPEDTPVTYWNRYTVEMVELEAFHTRYEDLNTGLMDRDNPVLLDLEAVSGLERQPGIKILTQHPHPSGPSHGPGIIGRWREFFSDDDLHYFNVEASKGMRAIFPEGW